MFSFAAFVARHPARRVGKVGDTSTRVRTPVSFLMTTIDFETIVSLVADDLSASGFALSRGRTQKWGARFTLERANIDGSVTISFGPVLKESDSVVVLPYIVIHGNTFSGQIKASPDSAPATIADRFLTCLAGIIENSLAPEGYSDPHVGVGLIDPV
jgi:hypothetical protein